MSILCLFCLFVFDLFCFVSLLFLFRLFWFVSFVWGFVLLSLLFVVPVCLSVFVLFFTGL